MLGLGAVLALGGGLWDDAWHTERGRDSSFIAPHLAIYGGISLVGAALSLWILLATRAVGLRAALTSPVIAVATASVGVTLASAPADGFWHAAFGRDAVIWSPPHTMGIVGTGSLAVAVLVDLARSHASWAPRVQGIAGGLLLASFALLVIEYDSDVPQFSARWYLPVLALGAGFALAIVIRLSNNTRLAATRAAGWHVAFLAPVSLFLVLEDLSPPRLPLLLAPALALDLSSRLSLAARSGLATLALFAVYVPAGYVGNGTRLDVADVLIGLPLAWAAFALTLGAVGVGRASLPRPPSAFAALLMLVLVLPSSAIAHDPGQGPDAGTLDMRVEVRDGTATVTARARPQLGLEPVGLIARRGGVTQRSGLRQSAPGLFRGEIDLGEPNRWFVYVNLRAPDGEVIEAWLPIDGQGSQTVTDARRYAYVVEASESSTLKWVVGVLLYAVVITFLGAVAVLVRRAGRDPLRQADDGDIRTA